MILLVYTSTGPQNIQQQLGLPEYSYRFVVREFLPLLNQLGTVIEVQDPEREVDAIYDQCHLHGEDCIFLCFMPPNKTPTDLACPTIPVFAWEYDTLPNDGFGGKPRNDWTRVLAKLGAGLTHSSFTVNRTKAALGPEFPIASIPAPLWNRMQSLRSIAHMHARRVQLTIQGMVFDSHKLDLSAYRKSSLTASRPDTLPLPSIQPRTTLPIEGVLYTAILNPYDGRKNWREMISAFCAALRERTDATLLLKLTHHDPSTLIPEIFETIYRMGTIACRIVLVHAYLDDGTYNSLLLSTTYAVNTSHGEGQCLPLMEYMSAGKPAIAPRHTSMLDYIDNECAFVIDSTDEPGAWPHDQRQALHTLRRRIHFDSLVRAYQQSYYVATHEPDTYRAMGEAAAASLQRYCSMEIVGPRLRKALERHLSADENALKSEKAYGMRHV